MCIRDSHPTCPSFEPEPGMSGLGELVGEAIIEHSPDQVEAVSYTHLRAHETVLDLVCRLLLEKKTNTRKREMSTTGPCY